MVTRAIGTCSIAPVAVLATTGVTPTARCLGMMTPETLVASAVRKIEPRLWGQLIRPESIAKVFFLTRFGKNVLAQDRQIQKLEGQILDGQRLRSFQRGIFFEVQEMDTFFL